MHQAKWRGKLNFITFLRNGVKSIFSARLVGTCEVSDNDISSFCVPCEHRASSIEHRASSIGHPSSNIGHRASQIGRLPWPEEAHGYVRRLSFRLARSRRGHDIQHDMDTRQSEPLRGRYRIGRSVALSLHHNIPPKGIA